MSRMQPAEVERIADLARLELDGDEVQRMTAELEAILGYVELLRALDTTGVEPTFHALRSDGTNRGAPLPFRATPLRDDRAAAPLDPDAAVANAPERSGSAFVVPKVLEEDEA